MELIPIIYTVLIIVVVLTIFTLIVSYIGSKAKQKKSENINDNIQNANILQPIVEIRTPLRPHIRPNEAKQISKQNEVKPISKPSEVRHVSKPSEAKHERPREKKIDDADRRDPQRNHSKNKVEHRTDKPRIQNERISILKNLSAKQTQEVIPPKTKTKTTKDQTRVLGDDILDKYLENEDSDMFTLKVKKNKDKPEDNV